MCTKECYTVLNRSKAFWGQFWGQICKTNSDLRHSNKCAALVPLRKVDTHITGFTQVKSPTSQYISFTLRQEVVRKPTPRNPRTPPLSPRETRLFGRVRTASAQYPLSQIPPRIFRFPGIFLQQRHLPRRDFPVQVNPTQINN